MFPMPHTTNSSGLVMPHGPYGAGNEDFLEFRSDSSHFRLQRLGSYLLSDLFSTGYMDSSGFVHKKPLVTLARGKEFYYTGDLLDQWDLDVLMYCARHTRQGANGVKLLRTDPADLLQTLKLRNDQRNRERVFDSLYRLHSAQLEIAGERYRYLTRLINRVLLEERKGIFLLEINADLVASLRQGKQMTVDIRDRFSLGRNGLAKWIHGALMVFKGGFSADINYLHTLCGSASKTAKVFHHNLAKAVEILSEAGAIEHSELHDDLLIVTSTPAHMLDSACGFFNRGA